MFKQPSNKPKVLRPGETIRLFVLLVQPEQPGLAWCATLEDEQQPKLEFHSPLELARYLADLKTIAPGFVSTGLQ